MDSTRTDRRTGRARDHAEQFLRFRAVERTSIHQATTGEGYAEYGILQIMCHKGHEPEPRLLPLLEFVSHVTESERQVTHLIGSHASRPGSEIAFPELPCNLSKRRGGTNHTTDKR